MVYHFGAGRPCNVRILLRNLRIAAIFDYFGAGRLGLVRILPILPRKIRIAAIFGNFGTGRPCKPRISSISRHKVT